MRGNDMGIVYRCSEYGAIYLTNDKLTSAHRIVVRVNKEPVASFLVPPLSGGFHFIGMVAVPKTPFDWEIVKY